MKHILHYKAAWKVVGVFVGLSLFIGAILILVPPTELMAAQ
jgi:hypothetical protein